MTNSEISVPSVVSFNFTSESPSLFIQSKEEGGGYCLQLLTLGQNNKKVFWKGPAASSTVFNVNSDLVCFIVKTAAEDQLWYYQIKDDSARQIKIANSSEKAPFKITAIRRFSQDNRKLFVDIDAGSKESIKKSDSIAVRVWNASDTKLYSQGIRESDSKKAYLAVIDIASGKLFQLQNRFDQIIDYNDRYALLSRQKGDTDPEEGNWNPATKREEFIVSINDGKLVQIPFERSLSLLSPQGKYVLHYDLKGKNYLCYDIATKNIYNLTKNIKTNWTMEGVDYLDSANAIPAQEIKWLNDDQGILMKDRYDIWELDPVNKFSPVNITNGYGKRNSIHFSIIGNPGKESIKRGDVLLLAAFNSYTKENGFFKKVLGIKGNPLLLTMGPFIYFTPSEDIADNGMRPVKSENAEVYIVKRMSAEKSPNFFVTKDFVSFQALTEVYPEKYYNWLSTELINWKGLDGTALQGVLFKPENFDPTKKYPLIIHYYQRLSNNLHVYEFPQPSNGSLSITYMVSNGYLVFTPDIHYKAGYPGESAFNSVVSSARFLSRLPYIDPNRIGIQGHSFGGYETNYIVTHTGMFAAACSASGMSDIISHYGSINGSGSSLQPNYETGQQRIGASLWERPDLYLLNSPIMNADKISTPILLNNNRHDDVVSFSQGTEFITALRRLRKRAWLVEYENEGHTIDNEKSALDFTLKMKQFFDHFFMKTPMPEWMNN
jgi:dienelactone hydrolase